MKNLPDVTLEKGKAEDVLRQIARTFGKELAKNCRKHELSLPMINPNGKMISYGDLSGMDVLILDIPGKVDWRIRFTGEFSEPIMFISMCAGTLDVASPSENFDLATLQSSIYCGADGEDQTLHFKGDEGVAAMIIYVHKTSFFKEMECENLELPSDLMKVIEGFSDDFLFEDIFHLPIIDAVSDVIDQHESGLLNSSFAASRVHEVLYLMLNEYKTYGEKKHRKVIRRESQVQLIRDAKTILNGRLRNPPTIPELAHMVGLNQQTLKQGFRQLLGKTINQQLNDKRLEQAGILLRAGELSVGEVAAEVGYNNPGYFSRRFREKYGVTPSYFNRVCEED